MWPPRAQCATTAFDKPTWIKRKMFRKNVENFASCEQSLDMMNLLLASELNIERIYSVPKMMRRWEEMRDGREGTYQ